MVDHWYVVASRQNTHTFAEAVRHAKAGFLRGGESFSNEMRARHDFFCSSLLSPSSSSLSPSFFSPQEKKKSSQAEASPIIMLSQKLFVEVSSALLTGRPLRTHANFRRVGSTCSTPVRAFCSARGCRASVPPVEHPLSPLLHAPGSPQGAGEGIKALATASRSRQVSCVAGFAGGGSAAAGPGPLYGSVGGQRLTWLWPMGRNSGFSRRRMPSPWVTRSTTAL